MEVPKKKAAPNDENNNRIAGNAVKRKENPSEPKPQATSPGDMEVESAVPTMDLRSHCEDGTCLAGPGLTGEPHVHRHKRTKTLTPPPIAKRLVSFTFLQIWLAAAENCIAATKVLELRRESKTLRRRVGNLVL